MRDLLRRTLLFGGAAILLFLLFQSGALLRAEIVSIRIYQRLGSPLLSRVVTCRFEPTCSRYALQRLEQEGFLTGNLSIARRLVLCSPIGLMGLR